MSDTQQPGTKMQFDELPDAPPRRKIKLSWPGKIAIGVLIFWAVIVAIGPYIAPYSHRVAKSFAKGVPRATQW